MITLRVAAFSLLALAACDGLFGGDDEPAGTASAAGAEPTATEATPEEAPVAPVVHTLAEGETLWELSRAYGVSVREIQRANALTRRATRRLSVGAELTIPGASEVIDIAAWRAAQRGETEDTPDEGSPEPASSDAEDAEASASDADDASSTGDEGSDADAGGDGDEDENGDEDEEAAPGAPHPLGAGETLWEVARLYDVSLPDLMAANGFDDDAVRRLRPGQEVRIPGASARDIARVVRERDASVPRRGIRVTLREGETIWTLATRYHVPVAQIMAANSLSAADVRRMSAGARLVMPGVRESERVTTTRRLSASQRRAMARARTLGLGTRQAASDLMRGRVRRAWIRAAGGRSGRLPGTLRWPVTNGRFVRGYGSGEAGYHLAVDIAGDIGWNVRAAAPGIVGYSGSGVRGYGNMVLVVHPGGWVTMYAHNSVNFVVPGQRVRRGQVLAELGSTGISRGPHVHFEFMYDGKNCDPATLFRPGVRHRSRLARITPETWTSPNDRPRAIRCNPRRRHPRSRWVVHE